jgi:hypothetical protein
MSADFECASLDFRREPPLAWERHKHFPFTASVMELRKLPCLRRNAFAHCCRNVVALNFWLFEDFHTVGINTWSDNTLTRALHCV